MDERTTRRVVVDVEVEARIEERPCRVFVTDLSVGGCMIELRSGDIIPGDRMVLHFERLVDVVGRMVWMRQGVGGVQFCEPLHEAVVEKLGFSPRDEDADEEVEVFDRFGRPMPMPRSARPQTLHI